MAQTVKEYVFGKDNTPKKIVLKGDKKRPESADHAIIFPGGSISVGRTTNDEYWAHIEIFIGRPGTGGTRESAKGTIADVHLDTVNGHEQQISEQLAGLDILHIAARIKLTREAEAKDGKEKS